MLIVYSPQQTSSILKIVVTSLVCILAPNMTIAQDQISPAQPFYGTVKTDGWVFELLDTKSDTSIYIPINNMAEARMRNIIERIPSTEEESVEFFELQPEVDVRLYNSEDSTRIYDVETDEFVAPLTPCPAGYCLPPLLFNQSMRLEALGLEPGELSIPVVSAVNLERYFQSIK